MEAPLQAQYAAPLKPLGFGLDQPSKPLSHMDLESTAGLHSDPSYLHESQFSPNGTPTAQSTCSATPLNPSAGPDEEECLVDSQPICFSENPFLVANRKGKSLPPGERILSGPPVGYGRQGQLQPWLFSKARRRPECGVEAAWCVTAQLVVQPLKWIRFPERSDVLKHR